MQFPSWHNNTGVTATKVFFVNSYSCKKAWFLERSFCKMKMNIFDISLHHFFCYSVKASVSDIRQWITKKSWRPEKFYSTIRKQQFSDFFDCFTAKQFYDVIKYFWIPIWYFWISSKRILYSRALLTRKKSVRTLLSIVPPFRCLRTKI